MLNFWSRDISRDYNVKTQEGLGIYFWGKMRVVVGNLARNIVNKSYAPNTP